MMNKLTKILFASVGIATVLACSGNGGLTGGGSNTRVAFTNACEPCGGVDMTLINTQSNAQNLIAQGQEVQDNSNPGDSKTIASGFFRWRATQHGTANVITELTDPAQARALEPEHDTLFVLMGSITAPIVRPYLRTSLFDVQFINAAPGSAGLRVSLTDAPDATPTNGSLTDYEGTFGYQRVPTTWRMRVTNNAGTQVLADTGTQSGRKFVILAPDGAGYRFKLIDSAH